jgi:hypothetical protein
VDASSELPPRYRETLRTLLRFAAVMMVLGLLSGILFQESSKKLTWEAAPDGLRWEAVANLAFLHGHVIGARPLGTRSQAWLTRAYLPGAAVSLALLLYKGYHLLLGVRWHEGDGPVDLDMLHAGAWGGATLVRHSVYGAVHATMGIGLGVFAVALWRSLRTR